MTLPQRFEEIRVYEGSAERTGVQFERKDVRHNGACCISLAQLARKARMSGDGYFYLPADLWPPDTMQIAMHAKWIVISSLP